MKSKNPTSIKFDESTAAWLATFCGADSDVPQHKLINMAVKELRKNIEAGCRVELVKGTLRLECPAEARANQDLVRDEERRASLKAKKT